MSLYTVIITAGGKGKRMNSDLPKQFIEVNDKPILMYTLEKFYHFNPKFQLIVTIPKDWIFYWEELIASRDFRIPHRIVEGGSERYHSIKNTLDYCSGDYILVHDGVRPLVSFNTIENCIEALKDYKSVIPVIGLKESLRIQNNDTSKSVNRSLYNIVQTPQCFKKEILLEAYNLPFHEGITDDSSLVEEAGFEIKMVQGNEENIKITRKIDLQLAGLFLK